MLRHPCILGGPQTNVDKIRIGAMVASGVDGAPRGAMSGRYAIKKISVLPKQGISGLRHTCIASSGLPSLGRVT